MNDISDPDDSDFLFNFNYCKRKAKNNVNELKKFKSSDNIKTNLTGLNKGTMHEQTESLVKSNSNLTNINFNQAEFRKEAHEKGLSVDENSKRGNEMDVQDEEKKTILHSKVTNYFSCPLCARTFDTELAHISHMKQCAKKSKMTSKQLLEALELHKNKLKNRIQLELPSVKKPKKTEFREDPQSSYQLALGLALSKSLSEANRSNENQSNTIKPNETTLENFGFISNNIVETEKKKLKNGKFLPFILKERTREERERLITEKAAVVLLSNAYEMETYRNSEIFAAHNVEHEKKEGIGEENVLWKLGEKEDNSNWYVQNIKDFILVGNLAAKDAVKDNTLNSEDSNIDEEIRELNLPRPSFFRDWKKLINNSHLSDINIRTKANETFYLHSVVLYARCPTMLDLDLQNVLYKFDGVTILKLLQYIYCGMLDGLKNSEIDNLFDLAQSVNFEELIHLLTTLKENLGFRCNVLKKSGVGIEMTKTLSQNSESIGPNLEKDDVHKSLSLVTTHSDDSLDLNSELSNTSLRKEVKLHPDVEDVNKKSYQVRPQNFENTEGSFWEQNKKENEVNQLRVEESNHLYVDKMEDEPKSPCGHEEIIEHEKELPRKYRDREIEDQESDMFEEAEIVDQFSKDVEINSGVIISIPRQDCEHECILVSSESSKDELSNDEETDNITEKNEDLPGIDCEIPYFDPYEHFNSEIPVPDSPVLNEEQILRSQSLFHNEISPLKLSTPDRGNLPYDGGRKIQEQATDITAAVPSTSSGPDFCSTPISGAPGSTLSSSSHKLQRKSSKGRQRSAKQSDRFKRNRSLVASRITKTKLMRYSSLMKKRKSIKEAKDVQVVADILTESILRDFEKSIPLESGKTPEINEKKFIEVTPAVAGEEFSEEVSPLPNYSIMNASTIKKHLTKYGLKKSLSKNKAKKILRHIYEELHPLVNTRNGKIIKYVSCEKRKKSTKNSGRIRKRERKSGKGKSLSFPKKKAEDEMEISETPCKNQEPSIQSSPATSSLEDSITSYSSTNIFERSEASSYDGNDSDTKKSPSKTNSSIVVDVNDAVMDFIFNNPDIHRRILMYEPIWLENFREQLCEKYNKKFKLTDIMDCLDEKCITFRCEKQRRTNSKRQTKRSKSRS